MTDPDGNHAQTQYDQLNRPDDLLWVAHQNLVADTIDSLDRLSTRQLEGGFSSVFSYAGTDTLLTQILHHYGSGSSATYS